MAARRGPGSKHCDGLGQAVHVLDPFETAQVDASLRASFNPLDALHPDNPGCLDDVGDGLRRYHGVDDVNDAVGGPDVGDSDSGAVHEYVSVLQ